MDIDARRFAPSKELKCVGTSIELQGTLPGDGAAKGALVNIAVKASDGKNARRIVLTKKLNQGGEGSVFETNLGARSDYVAKIYHRDKLTTDRRDKLRLMVSHNVECEGICFPVALILNESDEFVGYLMPKADGEELQKVVFNPMLLRRRHPDWTRRETILLCMTILNKIAYLNERNIILGDINPRNILVKSPSDVFFVDCDSYQVEGYPCPTGTPHFTPPEAQSKDYKGFLRTQEMENFAIATLMFMIMLPGKSPYAAVGGADPAENIRKGDFPYEAGDSSKIPAGKWGFIWNQMSFRVREAFAETFRKGGEYFEPVARLDAGAWFKLFDMYLHGLDHMLENDEQAADIFPTHLKRRTCKECGKTYIPDAKHYMPICPECANRNGKPSLTARERILNSKVEVRCASSDCSNTVLVPYRDRLKQVLCADCKARQIAEMRRREADAAEQRRLENLRRETERRNQEKWLREVWKTYPCKNPKCSNTITLFNRDRSRRQPEYCNECWQDVRCTKCGYTAAKWMHDERGGLCRRCYEQEKLLEKQRKIQAAKIASRTQGAAPVENANSAKGDKEDSWGWLILVLLLSPVPGWLIIGWIIGILIGN